jgi:hypothetical protein
MAASLNLGWKEYEKYLNIDVMLLGKANEPAKGVSI